MTNFDDKIHHLLLTAPRPKTTSGQHHSGQRFVCFRELVSVLIQECDQDDDKWKRFILALLYKRYHTLAPEAKAIAKKNGEDSSGHADRKLFYLAIEQLLAELDDDDVINVTSQSPNTDGVTQAKNKEAIRKAVSVLFELLYYVGGARDVCYILERAIESIILSNGTTLQLDGSLSLLIRDSVLKVEHAINTYPERYGSLVSLLEFASTQLDHDVQLVRSSATTTSPSTSTMATSDDSTPPIATFPSTLHIFIPHHGRGALSKAQKYKLGRGTSIRQVVNATAEVLLWSRTTVALKNEFFQASFKRFLSDGEVIDKSIAKASLHNIQTVIRKTRQELNSYARLQGFMLTDQFVHDPSKLTMAQIFKAKRGDMNILQKFATKSRSARVLDMVKNRFASDPSRIFPYASIDDFQRSWNVFTDPMDDISQLKQRIQRATVQKTVEVLRRGKIFPRTTGDDRPQVIASLDVSPSNHIAAAFLTAAKSEWKLFDDGVAANNIDDDVVMATNSCTTTTTYASDVQQNDIVQPVKLLIGNCEHSIHSFEDFIILLDSIVLKSKISYDDVETFMDEDGVATTKALLNILDRHLGSNSDLTLLTSAKVAIPKEKHVALIDCGSRVHSHDAATDIGERLNREGAKAGDITISLAWNTFDDLDLHVFLPSGEEISFSNKTALLGGTACLDVDMNAGSRSEQPVENVFIGDLDARIEAPRGKYKVVVQNYTYHTEDRSASIPWTVVVTMNGRKETYYGECQDMKVDVVACEFNYTGRTVPFPCEEDREKSTFETSDLVNLTASSGQTLESITQLVRVHQQLGLLNEVRLLNEDDMGTTTSHAEQTSRPTAALPGTLEVTSRDLTNMRLAGLPQKFQRAVAEAFGGISLVEACAKEIACRMVENKIPLSELKRQGYPKDVVDIVKRSLASAIATTAVMEETDR
jgi:hypothetical protein